MELLTLAIEWRNVAVGGGVVGFLFICILLVLTVLIQRPQGGGLSGAFGSAAGSGQTAFGAKTGDALTIFTIAMFVVYLLAAVGLNYAVRPAVASPDTPTASQTPASGADAAKKDAAATETVTPSGTKIDLKPVTAPQPGTPAPGAPAAPGTATPATPPAATPAPTIPAPTTPAPTTPDPTTPPKAGEPAPAGDKPPAPKPDQPK